MLYKDPKNLLQERLNSALSEEEESTISDLIKLSLLKRADKNSDALVFTELFNLLGVEGFTNLISLMDGRTITFPSREEFKDSLHIVLAYYYRNLENKSWDQIKEILGTSDINSVRLGIQAGQFEKFIQKMVGKLK